MTPYPHPILAREGWPFIALAVGAAIATTVLAGPWWSLPLWSVALFVVQFFRDPARSFEAAGKVGCLISFPDLLNRTRRI